MVLLIISDKLTWYVYVRCFKYLTQKVKDSQESMTVSKLGSGKMDKRSFIGFREMCINVVNNQYLWLETTFYFLVLNYFYCRCIRKETCKQSWKDAIRSIRKMMLITLLWIYTLYNLKFGLWRLKLSYSLFYKVTLCIIGILETSLWFIKWEQHTCISSHDNQNCLLTI